MFDALLKGIFYHHELTDSETKQKEHLKGLREPARSLWERYRSQKVKVDYSTPETREAYLLQYFPFYTQLIEKELNDLGEMGYRLPEVELWDMFFRMRAWPGVYRSYRASQGCQTRDSDAASENGRRRW